MNFKLGPELAEEQAKQAMGKQPEGKGSTGPAVPTSPLPAKTTPSVAVAPTPAPVPTPVPTPVATPAPTPEPSITASASSSVAAVDTTPPPAVPTVEPTATVKEPTPPPVAQSGTKPGAVEDIMFEIDSNLLTFKAKDILDDVVKKMKADSSLKVHVRGHSDQLGSRDHNLELSRKRAAAIEGFLLANGIAHSRMTTEAVGGMKPADPSNTPTAWARNRRVEIEWR
jgi:outer membrane protein OmpA-like peptidoglycan-associated protein